MRPRLLFMASLLSAFGGGACEVPAAKAPAPRAPSPPPASVAGEARPWAPDSVFRPETHRSSPVLPAGALRAGTTIRARDASPFSYFGQATAVDGDLAVVGAPYDDGAGTDAGAAYVFRRHGEAWSQEAKLLAPSPRPFDRFGFSVAVSGEAVVVGADRRDAGSRTDSGEAFVFRSAAGGWSLDATLRPRDLAEKDGLGISVAIAGDVLLAGAPGKDGAHPGAGAVYVFRRVDGTWREEEKLTEPAPTDYAVFGCAVSLSGDAALVGASGSSDLQVIGGRAYLFRHGAQGWELEAKLAPGRLAPLEKFGASVALRDGLAAVGSPRATLGDKTRAGRVSLFQRTDRGWEPTAEVTGSPPRSDEELGRSLSLGEGWLVAGSHFGDAAGLNTGVAYLFSQEGERWISRGPILASDARPVDEFGFAVAASDRWVLIGAPREGTQGNAAGRAYLYDLATVPGGAGEQ
jgi:FG-GAP repeat